MNDVYESSASPARGGIDHLSTGAGPTVDVPPRPMRAWLFCDAPERQAWLVDACRPSVEVDAVHRPATMEAGMAVAPDVDICVIDAGADGLTTLRQLRGSGYCGPTLVVAPCGDPQWIVDMLAGGADGVVCGTDPPGDVVRALQAAREGRPALSASAVRALIAHVRGARPGVVCEYRLTAREREIIALANKGYTFPQTAALIGVRVSTVYTHVRRLYEKMSVNSLPQALFEARKAGLL